MPAGISNPFLGYAGFCAIKLAGYSLAIPFISRAYKRKRNSMQVGAVRTLIGMIFGGLYFAAWWWMGDRLPQKLQHAELFIYLAGLLPIRIIEWSLLIWIFFDRQFQDEVVCNVIALATLWSYLLDVPAILGFIVTGGVWVC